MVCKLDQIIDFVREYKLLDDLNDEAIKETFDIFPHCCSWDKGLGFSQIDDDRLYVIVDKIMEILDDAFDHEYTEHQMKELVSAFCGVFDTTGAPKTPVPFVIVMLARI